jgi:Kef-type K+ transport system membrane component KefB/nucleotide-binding universal stress UspA family protein
MLLAAADGGVAPLSEHEVLVFLVQLVLLVGLARTLGGVFKMFGQPAVVGELIAGVLLGPSVFGSVAPGAYDWVFGAEDTVQSVMFGLAWLGVIMLLVVIGFETDLGIIGRFRKVALGVSAGALLVPLAAAGGMAMVLPEEFVGAQTDERVVFAGFFALALSVSALPVVAKILQDMGFLRRNFGQITLAAGMTMDAVGWLLLAALSGIALDGFEPVALAVSFGGLAVFVLVVVTVGRFVLDALMRWILDRGSSVSAAFSVTLLAALAGGIVTQALRLEAILGAFIVGILLATLRHQVPQVERVLEITTGSFFAPIFFAFSGLRVDIGLIFGSFSTLAWTVGLLVIAMAAKVAGTLVSGRLVGLQLRESLALGSGLSALGAMGIVVAIVGLNLGVLSDTGYTVAVVVAIITSIIAPQLLKLVVRGWDVPAEEKKRLEREEILQASEILGSERILLPTRGGRNSQYAAEVITAVFEDAEVTVLAVDVPGSWWQRLAHRVGAGAADPHDVIESLEGRRHRVVRKVAADPAAAIAREARLGYDLVLIGASEEDGPGVFSTVVDRVLSSVDIPTIVVRFPEGDERLEAPQRVLVPVVASRASRAAEELAYSLVRRSGGTALALHVVNRPEGQGMMLDAHVLDEAVRTGQEMVSGAAAFGERLGVDVETGLRVGPNAEAEIVAVANGGDYDLVVIGAANRPMTDRPFFGHRVTYMIEHSDTPIAIVSLPGRVRS